MSSKACTLKLLAALLPQCNVQQFAQTFRLPAIDQNFHLSAGAQGAPRS